jgi:hypothetical protein
MKINIWDTTPDGLIVNIEDISLNTYEELTEILNFIRNQTVSLKDCLDDNSVQDTDKKGE